MIRCQLCKGMGLVKKTNIEKSCKKVIKKYTYSSSSQYGLYKECDNCMGLGKIKKN